MCLSDHGFVYMSRINSCVLYLYDYYFVNLSSLLCSVFMDPCLTGYGIFMYKFVKLNKS